MIPRARAPMSFPRLGPPALQGRGPIRVGCAMVRRTAGTLFVFLLLSGCGMGRSAKRGESYLQHLPAVGARISSDQIGVQMQAMALSFVGREDRVAGLRFGGGPPPECRVLVRDGVEVDPLTEIVRRAARAQVVIVNEAHH